MNTLRVGAIFGESLAILILLCYPPLAIIGGIGLLKGKEWGRKIAMAKERLLRIPEVSEKMVDEAISKIQDMFESTNSQELKVALAHFIERIEIAGNELTIHYSFAPDAKGIVPAKSDPGGI